MAERRAGSAAGPCSGKISATGASCPADGALSGSGDGQRLAFALYPLTADHFFRFQQYFQRWLQTLHATLADAGVRTNDRAALDPRLQGYVLTLDRWPLDQTPDWPALAHQHGLSAVHADRLFRRALGHSAAVSWRRRRLHYAKRSLLMPGSVSKAIASDLGFASPAAFSRWFKLHVGHSPRHWVQQPQTREPS